MSMFDRKVRDPERIPEVLSKVEAIWAKCPELRLCQLIGNCFKSRKSDPEGAEFYYTEDDDLIKKLEAMYKEVDVP